MNNIRATKVENIRIWRPGETTMLFVGGSRTSYYCETIVGLDGEVCGANVFTKLDEENAYECNGGCGVVIRTRHYLGD